MNLLAAWRAGRTILLHKAGGKKGTGSVAQVDSATGETSSPRCLSPFFRLGWLRALAWLLLAAVFGLLAARSLMGSPPTVPEAIKILLDRVIGARSIWLGSLGLLLAVWLGRRWCVVPAVAWMALNASWLLLGASLTDPQFSALVLAPDSVPIVGMVYLLAFFLWLAMRQAVENDRREETLPPLQSQAPEKVLVWPDLVYIELICMILVTALLLLCARWFPTPLEQPANAALTPNPAKAPWYFVGLQELLVYADAWLVGVVVPCAIVLGLMAIPYLDFNPQKNGCYTIRRRRFATAAFLFGFLMLWVVPILIGTFVRGPNWSDFGPYEVRDAGRLATVHGATLSQWFWTGLLGRPLPQAGGAGWARLGQIVWREIAGLAVLASYFLILPAVLGGTVLRTFRCRMGRGRYALMVVLLLLVVLLPLKMILRWSFDLSYLVSIPEWSLNL